MQEEQHRVRKLQAPVGEVGVPGFVQDRALPGAGEGPAGQGAARGLQSGQQAAEAVEAYQARPGGVASRPHSLQYGLGFRV